MVREGEQGAREMREIEMRQEREMREMKERQERETREMREKQEREMREKREAHIGEKARVDKRLKTREETHKKSLLKLTKIVENLTKKIENHDVGPEAGSVSGKGVEEVRRHLECPVCFEMMNPPTRIWQCPQSHLVCETCRDQLQDQRCPSCRTETVSQRARIVENMARALFGSQ